MTMDTGTRRRLVLGFISNWVSRLAGTIIQLVQVPVFLHFWDKTLYGEWLIVIAIPSYLTFSSIGFGSVAGNEMTMLMARGEREASLRVFQSCWWFIVGVCSLVVIALAAALYFLPLTHWLQLRMITPDDAKWVIFYLGCATLFGQLEQLVQSAYTCIGRYPYGTFIKSCLSLAAFAVMIVPVIMGHGARATALAFAVANAVGTVVLCIMARHDIPWLRYGWSHARLSEVRRLAAPAVAFMGFPIGNALNLQGTLLAVGYALGPDDVVNFGTARTVSRVALQMVQMVNSTFWPELSSSYGARKFELVRSLHRRACQMALVIALILILVMMTVGPWFLTHWTEHKVPPSPGLLFLLLLSVLFYSLWSTSSTLIAAINQHRRLAAYYIAATAVTLVVTYAMARSYGLLGAAGALILSELIMDIYVLPTSLRISHDTWGGFLASMWHIPEAVRPAAILARLRRTGNDETPHPEPDA
jgi:O-antigen/teichoic acid export membrane protein